MSEISIQIRRVSERVKQYFTIFGFRTSTRMSSGRSVIRGTRRLGFDEMECVIAETARGTSVGFYAVNSFQGLIYSVPYLLTIILLVMGTIDPIKSYLVGDTPLLDINWPRLIIGTDLLSFPLIAGILIVGLLPFFSDFYHQRIRLANLKTRFSFFTKQAVWETREVPSSFLVVKASRSAILHGWILSIIYFALFSFTDETLQDLYDIYQTNYDDLYMAVADSFSLTVPMVIGLLAAHKALTLRKENARYDQRSRISGNLIERRIDTIVFAIQAALISTILFMILISYGFMVGMTFTLAYQMLIFGMLGGLISGLIHNEGDLWLAMAYAMLIFFSALLFIFRTGEQSAYAYIIIIQLFLLPVPFIQYFSSNFRGYMEKYDIRNPEYKFENLPILALFSVYRIKKERQIAKTRYEDSLERDIDPDDIDDRIRIRKEIFMDKDSPTYKLILHYYELILSYTASFDDDDSFIYIPTPSQLNSWWENRTGKEQKDNLGFIRLSDRILWDPDYLPDQDKVKEIEKIGLEMVLSIK